MCKRKREPFSDYPNKDKVNSWDLEKNGGKKPEDYAMYSHAIIHFICFQCKHSFCSALKDITLGNWCPYCSGPKRCGEKDCDPCYKKTFEYNFPEMAEQWSDKNVLKPHEVAKASNKKYFFDCRKCTHEIYMALNNISRGSGCKYCADKAMCETDGCWVCFLKSFARFSPIRSKEWSNENNLSPRKVFNRCRGKFLFNCGECYHEYSASPDNVNDKKGCGCPHCYMFLNKSMNILNKTLENIEKITFTPEVPVICEGRNLRWDMVIETGLLGKIHIESDGPQHFSEEGVIRVSRGKSTNSRARFVDQRNRDLSKEEYIRSIDGLLYRFSHRQMGKIPELVERMLLDINNGVKGVIYLDDLLYKDWVKIN